MSEQTEAQGSIMVLEAGAVFPPSILEYQQRAPNAVVVAHAAGESMDDLSLRVMRRLNDSSLRLGIALVACAPSVDPVHLRARQRICQNLLSALRATRSGELVLCAVDDGREDSKHAVFELAGSLCEALTDGTPTVRVRFTSGRHHSGIVMRPDPASLPPRAASGRSRA
jgi:hypothetical protein